MLKIKKIERKDKGKYLLSYLGDAIKAIRCNLNFISIFICISVYTVL